MWCGRRVVGWKWVLPLGQPCVHVALIEIACLPVSHKSLVHTGETFSLAWHQKSYFVMITQYTLWMDFPLAIYATQIEEGYTYVTLAITQNHWYGFGCSFACRWLIVFWPFNFHAFLFPATPYNSLIHWTSAVYLFSYYGVNDVYVSSYIFLIEHCSH